MIKLLSTAIRELSVWSIENNMEWKIIAGIFVVIFIGLAINFFNEVVRGKNENLAK